LIFAMDLPVPARGAASQSPARQGAGNKAIVPLGRNRGAGGDIPLIKSA